MTFGRIMLLAVFVRILLFAWVATAPFPNEQGQPVSPLLLQPGIDFGFYVKTWQFFADGTDPLDGEPLSQPLRTMAGRYLDFFADPFGPEPDYLLAPPLLPVLLGVLDYRAGHTFPLALLFLATSCVVVCLWLGWMHRRGIAAPWLLLFALLPTPLWYSINISTDLLFAGCFVAFYLVHLGGGMSWRRFGWSLALLLLMAGARPNSLAIFLFVALDLVFRADLLLRTRAAMLGILGAVGLVVFVYYCPYFVTYVVRAHVNPDYVYFGLSAADFAGGVFEALPAFLDRPLSWLALGGAKLLYFVGLRPSFAGIDWYLLALRAAPGMILLPGLLHMVWCGDWRHRLLLALFALPILMGVTLERYNLAILPLLYFHGCLALTALASWGLRMTAAGARRRSA